MYFTFAASLNTVESSRYAEKRSETSCIKTAYDALVAKGTNYGQTDAANWTNNWGTMNIQVKKEDVRAAFTDWL
jgi:hypothetical protein